MDLDAISDRLDIEALLTRYTRAIDSGDWDRLDEVFTQDAAIDYTATGGIKASYAEVKPWLAQMLPIFPRRMHTLGQIDSQVTATPRSSRRTSTTRWGCRRRRARTTSSSSVGSTTTTSCVRRTAGARAASSRS